MTSQGYVKGLKYLIDEAVRYYYISKAKGYTGVMHRINMGCEIYPREKSFWDWEADKTVSVIDKYIYEMALYDADEAQNTTVEVREKLEDIDNSCDPYKWYEENFGYMAQAKQEKQQAKEKEQEWNVEDYAIGIEYRLVRD